MLNNFIWQLYLFKPLLIIECLLFFPVFSFLSFWWMNLKQLSKLTFFLRWHNIKVREILLGGSSSFQESVDMRSFRVGSPIRDRDTTGESWEKEKWGECLDTRINWKCWEHFQENTCLFTDWSVWFKRTREFFF